MRVESFGDVGYLTGASVLHQDLIASLAMTDRKDSIAAAVELRNVYERRGWYPVAKECRVALAIGAQTVILEARSYRS